MQLTSAHVIWIQAVVSTISIFVAVIVAWVVNRQQVKQNTRDIVRMSSRIFPDDPDNRPMTVGMCNMCQQKCKMDNSKHFDELMTISTKNNSMLCDLMGAIGEVKGWIDAQREGNINHAKR